MNLIVTSSSKFKSSYWNTLDLLYSYCGYTYETLRRLCVQISSVYELPNPRITISTKLLYLLATPKSPLNLLPLCQKNILKPSCNRADPPLLYSIYDCRKY